METRKLVVYGFIIFVLFIIAYLTYLIFFNKSQDLPVEPQINSYPSYLPTPTIIRENLPEKITAAGVSVANFYKTADQVLPNRDVIIKDNNDLQFVYYSRGDYFLLSINNSPFEETRKKSEKELLDILKINESEACKLKIRIITPQWVNPDFADQDYPFSFCQ